MTDSAQRIVSDYLAAVDRASRDLPTERRVELVTDLAEHIAAARAELKPETEDGVRDVLGRLGDPRAIVAEARVQLGLPSVPAGPVPAGHPAGAHATGRAAPPRPPGGMPHRPAPPPEPVAPVRASKVGGWLIAVIAVGFTVLLTVCCLGAGVYALRYGDGGPAHGPGEPPRPRPTLTVPGR